MKYFFIAIMIYMNVHIVNAQNYIMECSTECNSDTSYSNHVKNAINSSKDKYYHCRTKVFKKADFAISNIYISAYYENNSAWTKNLSWSNNVLSGNFSTL